MHGAAFDTPYTPWPGAEAPRGPVRPVSSLLAGGADGDPLQGTGQAEQRRPSGHLLRQPALHPPAGSQSDPKRSPIASGKGA